MRARSQVPEREGPTERPGFVALKTKVRQRFANGL
jgi:hypothetical protein